MWQGEIENAVSTFQVAILLVSAAFLASSFIREAELPSLLKVAEAGSTTILSVVLTPCLFTDHPELSTYQSVNDPARPWSMERFTILTGNPLSFEFRVEIYES